MYSFWGAGGSWVVPAPGPKLSTPTTYELKVHLAFLSLLTLLSWPKHPSAWAHVYRKHGKLRAASLSRRQRLLGILCVEY